MEYARRLLPWTLMPHYNNAVFIAVRGDVKEGRISLGATVYSDGLSRPFVPGAGAFIVSKVNVKDYRIEKGKLVVGEVDGYTMGFTPAARFVKMRSPLKEVTGTLGEARGDPSRFDVNAFVAEMARLESSKYFASAVMKDLKALDGLEDVKPSDYVARRIVTVAAGGLVAEEEVSIRFFNAKIDGELYTIPGIVPVALTVIREKGVDAFKIPSDARSRLQDVVERIVEDGRRMGGLALLHSTTKSRFTYVVGEIDADSAARARDRLGDRLVLAASPTGKGGFSRLWADLDRGLILYTLDVYPYSPPANVVLNYPPLNLAPLAAVVNDRWYHLRRIAREARGRLKYHGLDGDLYIEDLKPLSDAKIVMDDVRRALSWGYPKIGDVEKLLDGMERIGYIADFVSYTQIEPSKISSILVDVAKKSVKKRVKKEESEAKAEEEVLI